MPDIHLEDIDPNELKKFITFHDELNPRIWKDSTLIPMVRLHLLQIARAFYDFLELPKLKVLDIILGGSNASYNYTSLSDLDVHLIVDYNSEPCSELMANFFTTKKNLWNSQHNIIVGNQSVELYVQDLNENLNSNGIYSILRNKWIDTPTAKKPSWNDSAVIAKTSYYAEKIDDLLENNPNMKDIADLFAAIKKMRKSGLESGGEFSTENLTFKSLRNLGYIEKLSNARMKIQDDRLSY